jgi:hypothetical protein
MNVLFVFLIILIVVIVILIVVHKSKVFTAKDSLPKKKNTSGSYSQSKTINQYAPQPTWGQPSPNPSGNGSGQCSVYTFIGGQYTPAVPSYSALNSGGRGFYTNKYVAGSQNIPIPTCIDSDQLFAYTYQHTCENPQGSSSGAGCILTVPTNVQGFGVTGAGSYVPAGTIEGNYQDGLSSKIYGQCTPSNLANTYSNSSYCMGNIGLIIPNFQPQPLYNSTGSTGNMCMNGLYGQTGGTTNIGDIGFYNVNTVECDLSDPGQIFRMTRYTVNPDGTTTQDDNGNVASIVHRYTGYYLAPNLNIIPITKKDTSGTVKTTFFYDFTSIQYDYDGWTDESGNTGVVSAELLLIPPSADVGRNGVYWLLQNQTFSAQYSSTASNIGAYRGVGVMVNQINYQADFPNGPAEPSYYAQQTLASGVTGPYLLQDGTQANCLFTNQSNPDQGSISYLVPHVASNTAPQQIVYVPDLRLLPSAINQDPSRLWSYLVNNLSINVKNDGTPFLTPYRLTNYIDIGYSCFKDPKTDSNFFTVLTGIVNSITNTPSDTQFINYNLYTTQIQMGVTSGFISGSTGTSTGNSAYSQNSNSFISR